MPKFVTAVVKATRRKQRIPAHWLEHPVLSELFTKTPSQRKSEEALAKQASADETPATGDKED